MKPKHHLVVSVFFTCISHAHALDGTWTGTAGNWSAPATWTGGVLAAGTDFTASFTGVDITADTTITVDTPRTIGNIVFTDATTNSHDLTLANSAGKVLTLDTTVGSPNLNVTQAGPRLLTITSVVAGGDGFTKSGAGRLFLNNNANTFTGLITLAAGSMQMNNNLNLGNAGNDIDVTGNFFIYNNSGANIALSAGRSITLGANLTLNGQGGADRSYSVAGPVSGIGGILLTGLTTDLTLTGGNSFQGAVSISTGGQSGSPAKSNHTILQVGSSATDTTATLGNSANAVSLGGFNQAEEGVAVLNGSAVLRFRRDDYNFSGTITGAGVVEISPADASNVNGSTITLTGNNSYTGITKVFQGGFKVASAWDGISTGSLSPANLRFDQHAILIIGGDLDPVNEADFARSVGTGANQVQWTNGGGFAASGADRTVDIGGAGALFSWTHIGTSNSLFLSHPDADAKLIFLNPIDLTATAGARFFRVHNGAAAIDAEIPSVISGGTGVGIQKSDLGILVLSGNNTYDGTTQINAGTLRITNAGSIDNSSRLDPRTTGILDLTAIAPYSIGTGRTLTGVGVVTGAVTVSEILSPGILSAAPPNVPGTLTTDAVTFTATTAFHADINSATAAADQLKANGDVALASATLALTDVAAVPTALPAGTKIALIDYTGHSLSGTFSSLAQGATVTLGANSFIIDYIDTTNGVTPGNYVTLTTPVAEPYAGWASSVGLTAPNDGKFDDKEDDGISNILEWVLGGNPLVSDTNILASSVKSGSDLVLTFNRTDSAMGTVALSVQYGSDLAGWTTVPVPEGSSGIFQINDDGATDEVIATIPVGAATVQFARLKAE